MRVTVVGLGLIGGSLGLALRKGRTVSEVIGYDVHGPAMALAREVGAVDRTAATLAEAVAQADVIVIATPVGSIVRVLQELAPLAPPGAILTDVGSTKSEICRAAAALVPRGVQFVGGHPMAGSERAGVGAADPYLFQNAVYALTPLPGEEHHPAVSLLERLVREIGAQPLILGAEEHDRMVAAVSHVPHVVAAVLVQAVGELAEEQPSVWRLAAGGFRDTTRIASGDPALWRDITLTNRAMIGQLLDTFCRHLLEMRRAMDTGDAVRVYEAFRHARDLRQRIPQAAKGITSPTFEMVVQVVDRPGALAEVTGLLARHAINIIDIEILRVREGEGGTLRLAVESAQALETSLAVLREHGYAVRRR